MPVAESSPTSSASEADSTDNDDLLLLSERADLDEETHHFGERVVQLHQRSVRVYDGAGVLLVTVPLADIKSARTEPLVGGARLELTLKNGTLLPLVECTARVSARISELARGIEQLAQGEGLAVKLTHQKTRCERCNRLLPEPDSSCPACVQRAAIFRRILSYLGPYRVQAVSVIGGSLLIAAINTFATPKLTEGITDKVLGPRSGLSLGEGSVQLGLYVGGMLLALLLGAFMQWYKNYNASFLSANIAKDLRASIYRALEHLQLSFFDKRQMGAIISRVTQDTDRVWGFLVDGVPYLLSGTLTLVGGLVSGLWLSWKLTLAILLPVPLVAVLMSLIWKPMASKYHKVGQKWGRLHTQLNESLNGIRVVKAFVREDGEWDKFRSRNSELAQSGLIADRWWFRSETFVTVLVGLAPLINWGFGGYLVLHGELTLGKLMAMQILLWQVYGPLQWFGQVNQWFSRAMAGAERVFEVIDSQSETYDKPGAVALEMVEGEIRFENVRFGYDKSNPVLKGIDLTVKPGELIGLVGRSGAGKSTTVNLLCRFYEADGGCVRLDGIDLRDIELSSLRKHIGIVLQEPFLFNGTIAENIAYGKPEASFEEIIEAARAACAHEFIVQKPDAYDTNVGEKGGKLSGGEKQRISIARAILHNPKILILDEATSSVDVETEKKIQQAIGNLTAGRTTFAIAHRLSTLRNADRLVVIEKGRIAELGTHAELMEKQGIFYNLVETQNQTSKALAETI